TCVARWWRLLAISAALAVTSSALPAWAALGGDITSVQADQAHMRASLRTSVYALYAVHEMQSASGTVVREYVSSTGQSAGKVFALAWQGPWRPDMQQILGNYFEQFAQAAQSQSKIRMGRRPLIVDLPGLVVEQGGHAGAFAGRAYVPGMLPTGVRAEEIQ
ncbi:MAG: DUF2844 domain-containing protein, partial [Candidatus Sulfotelmatobacter sp.]